MHSSFLFLAVSHNQCSRLRLIPLDRNTYECDVHAAFRKAHILFVIAFLDIWYVSL